MNLKASWVQYAVLICLVAAPLQTRAVAQGQGEGSEVRQAQELAKKVANPVAKLISFPVQYNYDRGFGPEDGGRLLTNIQPVIPLTISQKWNLISRTIVPVISQSAMFAGEGSEFGIGDITQSFFLSPAAPPKGGLTWGAGPVLLLPAATSHRLGAGKWGAGPTLVVLKQQGPHTTGVLMNHIWSLGGSSRADISCTLVQPFVSFTTRSATTFSLSSEATYDWKAEQWAVPVNLTVAQLTRFGKLPVSVGGGVRYWAASPDGGPEGFGLRLSVTYLFPR